MARCRIVPALVLTALLGAAVWPAQPVLATTGESVQVCIDEASLPRGTVLRRVLRSDSQQEYLLYVPEDIRGGAPLLVAVHGISRNSQEHAELLSPFAESRGAVLLAPCFTDTHNDDYQRLGRTGRGIRSDAALDAIIDEVGQLTGARADRIYLFGFSGGAQFAHRYVMAHPERVARAAVAAAGWYTFPDPKTPYPYGIGATSDLPDVRFDPDAFLNVPIAVFVGEEDVTDQNLRSNPEVDRQQGKTRVERAQRWVAAMRAAAAARGLEPQVTFYSVPGIRHSFGQFMREGELGERVFDALFGPMAGRVDGATEQHAVPAGGAP